MNLTSFTNGMNINIHKDRIVAMGPHSDGGSFINWNGGTTIHVKETPEEIKKLINNDRQDT